LKEWLEEKVTNGHLVDSDISEIYEDDGSLRLGVDTAYSRMNFSQMMDDSARSSAPPLWPGVLTVLIGFGGIFSLRAGQETQEAEQ
jgi:hypothetical protein